MTQRSNLTLKNAADADVVYYPTKVIEGEQAFWVDRSEGVIAAQSKASVFLTESQTTRKVSGKVTLPVWNATLKAVELVELASFELKAPLTSALPNRKELFARFASLAASPIVQSAFEDGEGQW